MFAHLYFSLLLAFAVAFILVSSAPVAPESQSLRFRKARSPKFSLPKSLPKVPKPPVTPPAPKPPVKPPAPVKPPVTPPAPVKPSVEPPAPVKPPVKSLAPAKPSVTPSPVNSPVTSLAPAKPPVTPSSVNPPVTPSAPTKPAVTAEPTQTPIASRPPVQLPINFPIPPPVLPPAASSPDPSVNSSSDPSIVSSTDSAVASSTDLSAASAPSVASPAAPSVDPSSAPAVDPSPLVSSASVAPGSQSLRLRKARSPKFSLPKITSPKPPVTPPAPAKPPVAPPAPAKPPVTPPAPVKPPVTPPAATKPSVTAKPSVASPPPAKSSTSSAVSAAATSAASSSSAASSASSSAASSAASSAVSSAASSTASSASCALPQTKSTRSVLERRDGITSGTDTPVCGIPFRLGTLPNKCSANAVSFTSPLTPLTKSSNTAGSIAANTQCDHALELQALKFAMDASGACKAIDALIKAGGVTNPSSASQKQSLLSDMFDAINGQANAFSLDTGVNSAKRLVVQAGLPSGGSCTASPSSDVLKSVNAYFTDSSINGPTKALAAHLDDLASTAVDNAAAAAQAKVNCLSDATSRLKTTKTNAQTAVTAGKALYTGTTAMAGGWDNVLACAAHLGA